MPYKSLMLRVFSCLARLINLRLMGLKQIFDTSDSCHRQKMPLNTDVWQDIQVSLNREGKRVVFLGRMYKPQQPHSRQCLYFVMGKQNHKDYHVSVNRIHQLASTLNCVAYLFNHRPNQYDLDKPLYHTVSSLSQIVTDHQSLCKHLIGLRRASKWCIMGHSFGGLIASHVFVRLKQDQELFNDLGGSVAFQCVLSQGLYSFWLGMRAHINGSIDQALDRLPQRLLSYFPVPRLKQYLFSIIVQWVDHEGFNLNVPFDVLSTYAEDVLITGLINDDTIPQETNVLVQAIQYQQNQPYSRPLKCVELVPKYVKSQLACASNHCAYPDQLHDQTTQTESAIIKTFVNSSVGMA
ncbi:MAG: hypothetical protein VXY77_04945 [Pseudomonadota bacterium]|nr:hypothetical protein [Pseudomonadota bacterium]